MGCGYMALQLSEKDLEDPEVLGEKLFTLAEIVVARHYYASSARFFDDMRSVAVLKALSMIKDDHFDKKKGNFASFIYTGMRNEVHNFLYHENKRDYVDLDVLIDQGEDDNYFVNEEGKVYISYSLIHSVCMSFMPVFGENIENLVILKLEEIGYTIKGRKAKDSPAFVYRYDPIKEEYGKDAEDEIISRLIGIILWRRKEKENAG